MQTVGDMSGARRILSELVQSSEAVTALLISREGICLGHAGDVSGMNTTALAALVAAMFAATREVATIVGEDQFSILLQQGIRRHIHISIVAHMMMMVVVFEDAARIGKVRHWARKAGEQLAVDFAREDSAARSAAPEIRMSEFREFALNLVDRIFQEGEGGPSDAAHQPG
jgi:predicted regulator of Ras-like GTPase activity (Roadblock/LC7/MglB family)